MIRVALADDQELVRDGFAAILEAQDDLEVVGHAGDGAQAVEVVRRTRPDVVLMDVRMPVLDGLEATRRITAEGLPTRVLVLTTFDLDAYVAEALKAGASGFLLKDIGRHELAQAVRVVARGDALLAPQVTRRLIASFAEAAAPTVRDEQALAQLTPREREVLLLVARGLSNAEIAQELVVSEHTVKTHVARLLTKLGLRDRVQAVVYAYEHRLVTPSPL